MTNINKITFFLALLLISATTSVKAQEANENLDMLVDSTKSDLLIVVGGGLAGAVLGLSTLSFVEEPKEHTRNIIMGASIGIIAGVGYVAFSQANKTQELIYGAGDEDMPEGAMLIDTKNFNTYARSDWHSQKLNESYQPILAPLQFGYNVRF